MTAVKEWRCFHCDTVFTDYNAAWRHFAPNGSQSPTACLREAADAQVLAAHRRATKAETDLADLRAAVRKAAVNTRHGWATASLPFNLWRTVVLMAGAADTLSTPRPGEAATPTED